jgi:hypothetical protein
MKTRIIQRNPCSSTSEGNSLRAIYPLGREATAINTLAALQDFVSVYGIPQTLYCDYSSNCNLSQAWIRFCRQMVVVQHSSEAHHHESNSVERSWQNVKQNLFNVMREYMVPVKHTMVMLTHIVDCLNHSATGRDSRTPLAIWTGDTPDISIFRFRPYEPIWFLKDKATLATREWIKGRFLGIAWRTGDQMCYRVTADRQDS